MTSAVKLNPVITAVTDSQGNQIPNGGTTKDTTVSVKGSAARDQEIKLYNKNIEVFSGTVGDSGIWNVRLTGLAVGVQAITAKSGGNVSTPWSFTVALPK